MNFVHPLTFPSLAPDVKTIDIRRNIFSCMVKAVTGKRFTEIGFFCGHEKEEYPVGNIGVRLGEGEKVKRRRQGEIAKLAEK